MGASSTLLPVQQFQILSPDQANPLGYGISQGIGDYLKAMQAQQAWLQNKTMNAQLPYAGQQAAANLGLTQNQSGLLGSEAKINQYQLQHPGMMYGDIGKQLEYIRRFGDPDKNNSNSSSSNNGNGYVSNPQYSDTPEPYSSPVSGQLHLSLAQKIQDPLGSAVAAKNQEDQNSLNNNANQQLVNEAKKHNDDALSLQSLNESSYNAYQKSLFKGPSEGLIPSKGIGAGLINHFHDMSNEQTADRQYAALQGDYAQNLSGGARTTSYDYNQAGFSKPGRQNTPQSAKDAHDFFALKSKSAQEELPFTVAAAKLNYPNQIINALYGAYKSENPYVDDKTGTLIPDNLNKWGPYLTNYAVQRVQAGLPVKSSEEEKQRASNNTLGNSNNNLNTSESSTGQGNIGTTVNLSGFKNDGEFANWYRGQPDEVKAAVKRQMGRG